MTHDDDNTSTNFLEDIKAQMKKSDLFEPVGHCDIDANGIKEHPTIRLSFQERSSAMARQALKILKEKKDWGLYGFSGYGHGVHKDENRSYYVRPNTIIFADINETPSIEDPNTGIINFHCVHITHKNIHNYPSSHTVLFQFADQIQEKGDWFKPEFKGNGFKL